MVGSNEFRRSEGVAFRRISQMRKEAEGQRGTSPTSHCSHEAGRAELDLSLSPESGIDRTDGIRRDADFERSTV